MWVPRAKWNVGLLLGLAICMLCDSCDSGPLGVAERPPQEVFEGSALGRYNLDLPNPILAKYGRESYLQAWHLWLTQGPSYHSWEFWIVWTAKWPMSLANPCQFVGWEEQWAMLVCEPSWTTIFLVCAHFYSCTMEKNSAEVRCFDHTAVFTIKRFTTTVYIRTSLTKFWRNGLPFPKGLYRVSKPWSSLGNLQQCTGILYASCEKQILLKPTLRIFSRK